MNCIQPPATEKKAVTVGIAGIDHIIVTDKGYLTFRPTKAQHPWLEFIDKKKIDLGKGDRSIIEGGAYNAAFHITIPRELAS